MPVRRRLPVHFANVVRAGTNDRLARWPVCDDEFVPMPSKSVGIFFDVESAGLEFSAVRSKFRGARCDRFDAPAKRSRSQRREADGALLRSRNTGSCALLRMASRS